MDKTVRTVLKETLEIDEAIEKPVVLSWRKGAQLLHVDYKTWGNIDFWMEVDDEVDFESRAFQVYPTGDPIPADASFVGTTVQRMTDDIGFVTVSVWHVYERTIPPVEG